MSSIWSEIRKALVDDAERARRHARAEGPEDARDGVRVSAHVHDHLHDELRAFDRIRGAERPHAYYPDEGKEPRSGPDGGRAWRRGTAVRESSEAGHE